MTGGGRGGGTAAPAKAATVTVMVAPNPSTPISSPPSAGATTRMVFEPTEFAELAASRCGGGTTAAIVRCSAGVNSCAPMIIRDRRATLFVTAPASARYFAAFLARERSAGQVARELAVDVGSVLYRIKRMCAYGLIRCTRIEPRAGRPIRYYRAVADAVFAPLELTSLDSVAELMQFGRRDSAEELDRALETAWLRLGSDQHWGTHIYRHSGGDVNRDFVPRRLLGQEQFWSAVLAAEAPAVWDQYTVLHLTKEAAKSLQRHLSKLAGEYRDQVAAGDRTTPYLFRLAIAPAETL
jgi:hypothetical protein